MVLFAISCTFYFDPDCNFGQFIHCLLMFTTVKPIPRRVDVACYNETYKRKLEMFTKRVSSDLS